MNLNKHQLKELASYIDLDDIYQFILAERLKWFIKNQLENIAKLISISLNKGKRKEASLMEDDTKVNLIVDSIFECMATYFTEFPEELERYSTSTIHKN